MALCMKFKVRDVGFEMWGVGFRLLDLGGMNWGFRVWSLYSGCSAGCLGFGTRGLGFGRRGLGLWTRGLGFGTRGFKVWNARFGVWDARRFGV